MNERITVGKLSKERSIIEQPLHNWIKAAEIGKLNGAGSKMKTPKQINSRIYALRVSDANGNMKS